MFPEMKPMGTIRLRETKLTISCGASHEVFCYTFQQNGKKLRKNHLVDASSQVCHGFDLIMCKSKVQDVVSLGS